MNCAKDIGVLKKICKFLKKQTNNKLNLKFLLLHLIYEKEELVVILQARCSSRRLQKKVLKISGIPLVILCARRLSNGGAKITVATSKHKSDDNLVKLLAKNKINYYRGSLPNVLSRYQFWQNVLKKMITLLEQQLIMLFQMEKLWKLFKLT